MACPICGANCKCRKRGPGGLCCSCHKHKARPIRASFTIVPDLPDDLRDKILQSWERHRARLASTAEKSQAAARPLRASILAAPREPSREAGPP